MSSVSLFCLLFLWELFALGANVPICVRHTIEVELVSFVHEEAKNIDGKTCCSTCCSCPFQECDNFIESLCIGTTCFSSNFIFDDDYKFESTIGAINNSVIVTELGQWPGFVSLNINIYDQDTIKPVAMLSHALTGDLNNSKTITLIGGYNKKVKLTLLWSVYCEFGFPTTALPPDPSRSSDATMTVALISEASSFQTSSSSPPSSISPSSGVENSKNNQIPLIAGAAGGGVAVLVIVIVVIGVVVCRRRRDSDIRRISHANSFQPKRPTSMPSMPPPIDPHRYEEKEFPPSQDKTYEGPSVPSFARSDENPAYGCKPDNMYETMEDAVKKTQDRSLPRPPNEYSETNSKYLTLK